MRTVFGISMLLLSAVVFADKPHFGDTFSFALGGMQHHADIKISSAEEGTPAGKLDLGDIGLDDSATVLWGNFSWQFAQRWKIGAGFSNFDARGHETVSESGEYKGIDWEVGASLKSEFDIDLYIVDITWDFVQTDNARLGIGVGLHVADLDFDLDAEARLIVDDKEVSVDLGRVQTDFTAPLPNITLSGAMTLVEKVYLTASAGYFTLNYDKYDGELISLRGGVEWRPWKHFGIGAAYQYVDVDLTIDGSNRKQKYDMKFHGPILFVSAGF